MSYETHTVRFRELKQQAQRRLKCRACGKRFSRSRTFTQTLNPYNRRPDGAPKSAAEIYASLREQADAWQPDDLCTKCADAAC